MEDKIVTEPGTITYINKWGSEFKTKTILHADYWVEIPAGEYLIGVSKEQRELMGSYIRQRVGYHNYSWERQDLIESAVIKIHLRAELPSGQKPDPLLEFTQEEQRIWDGILLGQTILQTEAQLARLPKQKVVWVDRFYIARFPITENQWAAFSESTSGSELPGTFDSRKPKTLDYPERPEASAVMLGQQKPGARELNAAIIYDEKKVDQLCKEIGARLPTLHEWQKAAIGTDGRLYPWGNEWDPNAGYFHREDGAIRNLRVNAFLAGVSPYGVWSMVGGLTELVTIKNPESRAKIITKGHHPKFSSAKTAWLDHIVATSFYGGWTSLRLALDKWPKQQWQGVNIGD